MNLENDQQIILYQKYELVETLAPIYNFRYFITEVAVRRSIISYK